MTPSTDLGAALEAFILEHEYCGELDSGLDEHVVYDVHVRAEIVRPIDD